MEEKKKQVSLVVQEDSRFYVIDGIKIEMSVSKMSSVLAGSDKTNFLSIASLVADKNYTSTDVILQGWNRVREKGTKLHKIMEEAWNNKNNNNNKKNNKNNDNDEDNDEEEKEEEDLKIISRSFIKLADQISKEHQEQKGTALVQRLQEQIIFYEFEKEKYIVGQADLIQVFDNNDVILIDWKYTKNAAKTEYEFQLQLYSLILKRLGYNVVRNFLITHDYTTGQSKIIQHSALSDKMYDDLQIKVGEIYK